MTADVNAEPPTRETARPLRVAIVCPGAGVEQRGFERLLDDLFRSLIGRIDVTFFKGGGPTNEREIVLRFARRNSRLLRIAPVHALFGRTPIHAECATFALALLPHLRAGRYDVVHCIDPPLAKALFRLRARLGLRFGLMYSEATSMPPSDYPPCDLLHHIGLVAYEEAKAHGISTDRMALLQPGAHRFPPSAPSGEIRRRHGVADSTFLVLFVGAINRVQKRLDHLIEEFARVEGDVLLWIDGSMDQGDPTLIELARQRLGPRVRVTRVPSESLGDLYTIADVMVMPSVFEAFGLVLAEALASGTPVLMHDSAHFRWLAPNPACHVNMREPGLLAARLIALRDNPASRRDLTGEKDARERFDWSALAPHYIELYRRTVRLGPLPAPAPVGRAGPVRAFLKRVKFLASRVLRALGLLKVADTVYYWLRRAASSPRNRRFRRDNPGFATPPAHLAFDALNHTDWAAYRDSGLRHAGEFARIIRAAGPPATLDMLEWGCGPGRLLRHMAHLLPGHSVRLTGSDYNPESIGWCRESLPGVRFVQNDLAPPLPFDDASFDVVYCFSVFTHLSEEMQIAWSREILRVLRPGGVFVCTTHGDRCRHLLTTVEEHRLFNCGQCVVQGRYREGRKWFLAVQPSRFVREKLLAPFVDVAQQPVNEPDLLQDFWLARKPPNATP